MRPLGVHHVSVNVTDVTEALSFYVDVLGLTPRDDRPDFGFAGSWLDVGAQQIHLIEATPPDDRGQHLALQVDDLDAVVSEIRGRGVEISTPMAVGTGRQTFVHDPSGNLIELNQPAAATNA
jgi:glyoxylase I family protein